MRSKTNYVEHTHDGFTYRFLLCEDGHLFREMTNGTVEPVDAQTEYVTDEDGNVCPPDPEREAYIAALKLILETTA